MTIDEERIWLRVKVPAEDGTAVMEMTDPVVPENGPASLRSWVLAALEQRAGGATKAADRMVAALRERSWEGDDVLADQLEAWLGGGVVRDLRPLPLDLDELAGILDFAGYSLQRQPLILSFNLNSDFKVDLGCYPYITLFAWRNVRPFPHAGCCCVTSASGGNGRAGYLLTPGRAAAIGPVR